MNRDDFLDELADYLVIQGVADSAKIKVNKLTATPDTQVALLGVIGLTLTTSRDVPELEFPRFQVITRSADYNEASELMRRVREALHGKIGLLLPHFRVLRLHAEQDGGPIGEDPQGRSEFSINFVTEFHLTDSI